MRGEHGERQRVGALPNQIVAPFGIDWSVVAQPSQPEPVAHSQRLAVESNRRVQRTSVAHHDAIQSRAGDRTRRPIVVHELQSIAIGGGPGAEPAAIAADSLVEKQTHHGDIVPRRSPQINGTRPGRTDYNQPVSLLRRMFSADYRAAVAAEAAGNVDAAAQRYALAGELEGAVRMHIARAARATTRQDEIAALRDALRWAGDDPALRSQAARPLGRALLESATMEGVATDRDRARVREAAALLIAGGDSGSAGEALENIGDFAEAAQAYSNAGLIDKLEAILARETIQTERARNEDQAFKNYEMYMRVGRRDDARAELARAIASVDRAGNYRRLMDQLDSALITSSRVELKRRQAPSLFACAVPTIVMGRDALCDLPLRAGCVSRHHATIESDQGAFLLRDNGSRNGTWLQGLALAGAVPLTGSGRFTLGNDCAIDFELQDNLLVLKLADGVDRGLSLLVGAPEAPLDLRGVGLSFDMTFRNGRPMLGRGAATAVSFNGEPLGEVRVQLIRGDRIVVDGDEITIG